jgi:hypothetical protein
MDSYLVSYSKRLVAPLARVARLFGKTAGAVLLLWACRSNELNATANNQPDADLFGPGTCETLQDCTYATVPVVSTEADCSCPTCAHEAIAISRDLLEQRKSRFQEVCGNWVKANSCPPITCQAPRSVACGTSGSCELGN